MTGQRRYLAVGLNLSQAQPEEQPDGSLLVRNVPMLKVGTWTDSVVGTPLHYPLETLAVDASNWKSNSYWSRHSGGTPHDFDDKIALIETPRFMGDGVYADLRFHRSTQKSRDAAAYLMRMRELGQDVYSSVEHYWDETYNAELQRMEATGLTFLGAAMVDQGACRTCKIPQALTNAAMEAGSDVNTMLKKSDSLEGLQELIQTKLSEAIGATWSDGTPMSVWPILTFFNRVIYSLDGAYYEISFVQNETELVFGTPKEVEQVYVEKKAMEALSPLAAKALIEKINTGIETMTAEDIKKLEDQIKALGDQNAAIMKALEAQTPKKEEKSDEIKALEAALSAKDTEIKAASEAQAALDARIKALEQDGTTKTGGNQPAELSEPMNAGVSIDRKTGTIRRV